MYKMSVVSEPHTTFGRFKNEVNVFGCFEMTTH